MTAKRAVLVTVFIVLEAMAALGMIVISVHGPAGLGVAAAIYFVVAAGITWFAGRSVANSLGLTGVGIALLALTPGIFAVLAQVEQVKYRRRIAATRVDDVRDDAILSTTGRPIGVRLSYTVTVPERGYFGILPSLYARDRRSERLRLNTVRWTIDGISDPTPFEPRRTHTMVVELYPPILMLSKNERCLSTTLLPPLPDSVVRAPLRVMISETTYGNTYNGGTEQVTRGVYDLGELYRGVLDEGLAPCRQP